MSEPIGDAFCDAYDYDNCFEVKNDELWNGRQTEIIAALQMLAFLQSLSESCDQRRLDYFRQSLVKLTQNLSPQDKSLLTRHIAQLDERDFAFADPMYSKEFTYASANDTKIIQCRSFFSRVKNAAKHAWKGLKNAGKHVGHALGKAGDAVAKGAHKAEKFVRHHKKEVLIGVAVLVAAAAVAGIVVAVTSSAAAGAGAAANNNDKRKKDPDDPKTAPPAGSPPPPNTPTIHDFFANNVPPSEWKTMGERVFLDKGIMMDGQFYSYQDLQQKGHFEEFLTALHAEPSSSIPSDKPFIMDICKKIGSKPSEPDLSPLHKLRPALAAVGRGTVNNFGERSRSYETPGICKPHNKMEFINGKDNTFEEAQNSAVYISRLAGNHQIRGVYNQDHGVIGNFGEIFALNYPGYSPNTANLLQQGWTQFHEANKNNPRAKILHYCHSQGAIHTKNALKNCPEEIRQRVIVVAIAPAAVIPKRLCYDSFNYASEKDIVPYGEFVLPCLLNAPETGEENMFKITLEDFQELIWVKPHKDATGFDHGVISKTFEPHIQERAVDYSIHNGEYP